MLKIIFAQKVLVILACGGFSFVGKSIILLRGSVWWLVFIATSGFGNIFGKVRVSPTSAPCSPRSPVRIPDSCVMGRVWKCTHGWIDEGALRPREVQLEDAGTHCTADSVWLNTPTVSPGHLPFKVF